MKDLLSDLAYYTINSFKQQRKKWQEPCLCVDLWSKRTASEEPPSQAGVAAVNTGL